MKTIICILGARYHDKENGNTYHNTKLKVIEKDNGTIYTSTYYTGYKYGYENAYKYTAYEYIKNVLHISDYELVDMGAFETTKRKTKEGNF